jgi:hypothetical protein
MKQERTHDKRIIQVEKERDHAAASNDEQGTTTSIIANDSDRYQELMSRQRAKSIPQKVPVAFELFPGLARRLQMKE